MEEGDIYRIAPRSGFTDSWLLGLPVILVFFDKYFAKFRYQRSNMTHDIWTLELNEVSKYLDEVT